MFRERDHRNFQDFQNLNKNSPDKIENCQVFIGITSSRQRVLESLRMIIDDMERGFKPLQGIGVYNDGLVEIVRPYWEGKEF